MERDVLERYSYYWLTATNELKIGWDNAPHHTRLATFPYHKHVGRQRHIQPSTETRLEEVMTFLRTAGTPYSLRSGTRRQVDSVTDRRVAHAQVVSALADDDQAGVDADPHLQEKAALSLELPAILPQGPLGPKTACTARRGPSSGRSAPRTAPSRHRRWIVKLTLWTPHAFPLPRYRTV